MKRMLPIGLDDFKTLREKNLYFVDKSGLISGLCTQYSIVTIFTRPRRFGKSLNMSMLKEFFEIGNEPALFEGLEIMNHQQVCNAHMHQYPVISITLKDIGGLSFDTAYCMFQQIISDETSRLIQKYDLLNSSSLDKVRKNELQELYYQRLDIQRSLFILSDALYKVTGKKPIILIDEYDVPLQKAYFQGYYKEMVSLISTLFSTTLKSNPYLERAILTGCLRVSKESIFTGLNNVDVKGVTDDLFDEWFGFTDEEVKQMLSYYEIDTEENCDLIREWYDGYVFGSQNVYCPWDVIKYVSQLVYSNDRVPKLFWINTSSNDIVKQLADQSNGIEKNQIEQLIAGNAIPVQIHQEMTYEEINQNREYIWSVLLLTGYLTCVEQIDESHYAVKIPNREIKVIFETQVMEYFKKKVNSSNHHMQEFCEGLVEGNIQEVETILNDFMHDLISVRDTANKSRTENFYQAMIATMCATNPDWEVKSQRESGDGYPDIIVFDERKKTGFEIEIKYSDRRDNLETDANSALQQINEKHYQDILEEYGIERITHYGMAFYRKNCKIAKC